MKANRYSDIHAYCADTGVKKTFVAKRLGVSRFQLSGLLYPERYPVTLTPEIIAGIATLLNQPESYVRKLYQRAA